MKLRSLLGVGFTVASLYLNSQIVKTETANPDSQVNKKYLKHIQDLTNAYSKEVKFAKEHNQKPPNEYFLSEYIATMDPETGLVHNQNYVSLERDIKNGKFQPQQELKIFSGVQNQQNNKSIINQWVERGPYEIGGRIRGIMFDPNDATGKKVWAGGVSGGLWFNNDITNPNSEWTLVDGLWSNTSVSCITADPNNSQVFYVGTGEVETGDISGLGIWKTTDGGATWNQIFTTESGQSGNIKRGNYYVTSIKVVNNSGTSEVYAGIAGGYTSDTQTYFSLYEAGLYKSTNGSTFSKLTNLQWDTVNNIGYDIQDIEIGADNAIWVATRRSYFGSSTSGGRIFKSTDNGATFTNVYNVGNNTARVMVEVSATNPLKAYALMQGANTAEPVRIAKTADGGATWISTNVSGSGITLPNPIDTGQPDNDFTRGQAFYDLVIETDPANDEIVYVGGIDSYKSTNGGATWTQYTKWSNNNVLGSTSISLVHADQHALVFNPKNSNQFVLGNDGGIFFAADKNNLANTSAVGRRNKKFNITQFYHGTLNPSATSTTEEMILGAQDNGTQRLSGAAGANNFYASSEVYGGDGAYTAFDDQNKYLIASYVYNFHYLFNAQGQFALLNTSALQNAGQFINPLAVDRNLDIAYTNAYSGTSSLLLNRIAGLASVPFTPVRTQLNIAAVAAGENISKIIVSPYSTTSSTLFIGLSTGKFYKVTNANATPVASLNSFNFGGYISDIRLGASESEIMVTVSNFNKVSVYYTTDAGVTWISKEGNLPDIPVKAIFMNPENSNEVILGTYFGVWGTANFQSSSPTWALYSNGLGKFKVNLFDYRPSDKTVLAVTYGRGAFTTKIDNTLSTDGSLSSIFKNNVYPNPTRGPIHVKFDGKSSTNVKVEFYDASGKLVLTKNNVKSEEEFNIESLIKGIYVLKVVQNGTMIYTSIITKK